MQTLHQRFSVPFGYPVHFSAGILDPQNTLLADTLAGDRPPGLAAGRARFLPVIDGGLLAHHPELPARLAGYAAGHSARVVMAGPPVTVPGGEAAKNDPDLVTLLQRAVQEHGLCRHSYLVAIGGGAVIDLVGYAAATAHRGIRLVRVPTTVLAQNDAAIGVKNGVNAFGAKNFLGTFAPPHAVLNDPDFLRTLSDRDWRSGISEAVKVALIKDPAFFDRIESDAPLVAPPRRDPEAMGRMIHRCARLHLEHIAEGGDPFEMGSSRPLDFGHWAAHRLEHLTSYGLRHGEAVAIGIALDTVYSELGGLLDRPSRDRVLDLLEACGFELFVPEMALHLDDPEHPDSLFQGIREFREHLGGRLTIMLLEAIGRGIEVHEVEPERYRSAVEHLRDRVAAAPGVRR
jgi:3-dehydroquinate synthase